MRSWLRRQLENHPWLVGLVSVYLVLSVVELVRILRFNQPLSYAVGFYVWEEAAGPGLSEGSLGASDRPLRFRWTRGDAHLLEPVQAPVVRIPIYLARPEVSGAQMPVGILLEDRRVGTLISDRPGWYVVGFHLPPVLGKQVWQEVVRVGEEPVERRATARAADSMSFLKWFFNWQELKQWRRSDPPSVWFHFEVDLTSVPAETSDSDDTRELGIGVGELQWANEVPVDGIGFYGWERFLDGSRFRWTRTLASQPVVSGGPVATFKLRADHPDLEQQPVTVEIYWEARLLETVTLSNRDWLPVRVPIGVPPGTKGVLSIWADRVWNPSVEGISVDNRTLGVAMTEVRWQ